MENKKEEKMEMSGGVENEGNELETLLKPTLGSGKYNPQCAEHVAPNAAYSDGTSPSLVKDYSK